MALRTHFNQSEIGCPGVAEFTVQRTEALFDHIMGLRQISVAFGLCFRQRTVAVGFAHNAVQQLMLFQMLPVFRTVVAFVGVETSSVVYSISRRILKHEHAQKIYMAIRTGRDNFEPDLRRPLVGKGANRFYKDEIDGFLRIVEELRLNRKIIPQVCVEPLMK